MSEEEMSVVSVSSTEVTTSNSKDDLPAQAIRRLQQGDWVTGTAIDLSMKLLLPPEVLLVDYSAIRGNQTGLEKRFQEGNLPFMVVLVNIGDTHWTVAFLDTSKRLCTLVDPYGEESGFLEAAVELAMGFATRVDGKQAWDTAIVRNTLVQRDAVNCGIFAIVLSLSEMTEIKYGMPKLHMKLARHIISIIVHIQHRDATNKPAPFTSAVKPPFSDSWPEPMWLDGDERQVGNLFRTAQQRLDDHRQRMHSWREDMLYARHTAQFFIRIMEHALAKLKKQSDKLSKFVEALNYMIDAEASSPEGDFNDCPSTFTACEPRLGALRHKKTLVEKQLARMQPLQECLDYVASLEKDLARMMKDDDPSEVDNDAESTLFVSEEERSEDPREGNGREESTDHEMSNGPEEESQASEA